jgi:hypothetical protein
MGVIIRHKVAVDEALRAIDARLENAINTADSRGYTGMLHSKGGLMDDPKVVALMKQRDKLLAKRFPEFPTPTRYTSGKSAGYVSPRLPPGTRRG